MCGVRADVPAILSGGKTLKTGSALFAAAFGGLVAVGGTVGVFYGLRSVPSPATPTPDTRPADPVPQVQSPVDRFLAECDSAAVIFARDPSARDVIRKAEALTELHSRIPTTGMDRKRADLLGNLEGAGGLAVFHANTFLDPRSDFYDPDGAGTKLRSVADLIRRYAAEYRALPPSR